MFLGIGKNGILRITNIAMDVKTTACIKLERGIPLILFFDRILL